MGPTTATITMNQNNYNSTSISSSSSTRRGSIRREEGEDDHEDDDDDFGVDVVVDVDNQAPVACPDQMVVHCKTFNIIDRANTNGGSKTHGWTPKLLF